MAEAPFEERQAHQWFAVELNNQAWDLVEAEERSAEDVDRMIHAAHAACYHWSQVGNALNALRAQHLLAAAHAAAGLADTALRYAERGRELSEQAGDEQSAFDRALTCGCLSRAKALGGRLDEARAHYAEALAAAETFDHPSERPVFDKLFPAP